MLGYNQWCPKCKSGKGIVKLTIPYAAKLLIQEVSHSFAPFPFPISPSLPFLLCTPQHQDVILKCLLLLSSGNYGGNRADSTVDGNEYYAQIVFGGYSLGWSIGYKGCWTREDEGGGLRTRRHTYYDCEDMYSISHIH
jgi:hypothetical protein